MVFLTSVWRLRLHRRRCRERPLQFPLLFYLSGIGELSARVAGSPRAFEGKPRMSFSVCGANSKVKTEADLEESDNVSLVKEESCSHLSNMNLSI